MVSSRYSKAMVVGTCQLTGLATWIAASRPFASNPLKAFFTAILGTIKKSRDSWLTP